MSQLSDDLADWLYMPEDDLDDLLVPEPDHGMVVPNALYMVQFQMWTLGFSFALSLTWVGCSELCVLNLQQTPDYVVANVLGRVVPMWVKGSIFSVVSCLIPWRRGGCQKHFVSRTKVNHTCSSRALHNRSSLPSRFQVHHKGQSLRGQSVKGQPKVGSKPSGIAPKLQMKSCDSTATLNDIPEMCRSEIAVPVLKPGATRLGSFSKPDSQTNRRRDTLHTLAKRGSNIRIPHPDISKPPAIPTETKMEQNPPATNNHPQPGTVTLVKPPLAQNPKEIENSCCWIYNQQTNTSTDELTTVTNINFERTQSLTSILMEKAKKPIILDTGFKSYSPYTPPVRYINIGKKQAVPVTRNLITNSKIQEHIGECKPGNTTRVTHKNPLQQNNTLCSSLISTNVDDATTDLICGDMQLIVNKYAFVQNSHTQSTANTSKKETNYKHTDSFDLCKGDSAQINQKEDKQISPPDQVSASIYSDSNSTLGGIQGIGTISETIKNVDFNLMKSQKGWKHEKLGQKCTLDIDTKNRLQNSGVQSICNNGVENGTKNVEQQDSSPRDSERKSLDQSSRTTRKAKLARDTRDKAVLSGVHVSETRMNVDETSQRSDRILDRSKRRSLPSILEGQFEDQRCPEIPQMESELPKGLEALPQKSQTLPRRWPKLPQTSRHMPQGLKENSPIIKERPRGSDALPRGSDALPRGPDALPRGSDALPRGSDALPRGPDALPRGSDALPRGSDALPRGSNSLPNGSDALPRGSDALPRGSDALPKGSDALPNGSDALPRRSDALPKRLNTRPKGFDALPKRLQALHQRLQILPKRLQQLPQKLENMPHGVKEISPEVKELPKGLDALPKGLDAKPKRLQALHRRLQILPKRLQKLPHTLQDMSNSLKEISPTIKELPKRLDTLPKGLDALPKRLDALPKRLDALPKRLDALPKRLDALPKGLDASPKGLDALPKGLDARPRKLQTLPQRVQTLPRGLKESPPAATELPKGFDELSNGLDTLPNGLDTLPNGLDALPKGVDEVPKGLDALQKGVDKVPKELNASPHKIPSPQGIPHELQKFPQKLQKYDNSLRKARSKVLYGRRDQTKGNFRCRPHEPLVQSISTSLLHSIKKSGKFKIFYETNEANPSTIKGPIRGKSFVDKFRPYKIPVWRRGVQSDSELTKIKRALTDAKPSMGGTLPARNAGTQKEPFDVRSLPPRAHSCSRFGASALDSEAIAKQSLNSRTPLKPSDAVAFLNLFMHMPKYIRNQHGKGKYNLLNQSAEKSQKSVSKLFNSWGSVNSRANRQGFEPKREFSNAGNALSAADRSSFGIGSLQTRSSFGSVLSQRDRKMSSLDTSRMSGSLTESTTKAKLPPEIRLHTEQRANRQKNRPGFPIASPQSKRLIQNSVSQSTAASISLGNSYSDMHRRPTPLFAESKYPTLHEQLIRLSEKEPKRSCFENRYPKETILVKRELRLPVEETGLLGQSSGCDWKQAGCWRSESRGQRSKLPVLGYRSSSVSLEHGISQGQLTNKLSTKSTAAKDGASSQLEAAKSITDKVRGNIQHALKESLTSKTKSQEIVLSKSGKYEKVAMDDSSRGVQQVKETSSYRMKKVKEANGSEVRQVTDQISKCLLPRGKSITFSKMSAIFSNSCDPQLPLKPEDKDTQVTIKQAANYSRTDTLKGKGSSFSTAHTGHASKMPRATHTEPQQQPTSRDEEETSKTRNEKTIKITQTDSSILLAQRLNKNEERKLYSVQTMHSQTYPGASDSASDRLAVLGSKRIDAASLSSSKLVNVPITTTQSSREYRRRLLVEHLDGSWGKGTERLPDRMRMPGFNSCSEDPFRPSLELLRKTRAGMKRLIRNDRSIACLAEGGNDSLCKRRGSQTVNSRVPATGWVSQAIKDNMIALNRDALGEDVAQLSNLAGLKKTRNTQSGSNSGIHTSGNSSTHNFFSSSANGRTTPETGIQASESRLKAQGRRMAGAEALGKSTASFTKRNMAQDVKTKLSSAAVKWFCNVCEGLSQPEVYSRMRRNAEGVANETGRGSERQNQEFVSFSDQSLASGLIRPVFNSLDSSLIGKSPDHKGHPDKRIPVGLPSTEDANVKPKVTATTDKTTKLRLTDNFKIDGDTEKPHIDTSTDGVTPEKIYPNGQPHLSTKDIHKNPLLEKVSESKGDFSRPGETTRSQIVDNNKVSKEGEHISLIPTSSGFNTGRQKSECNTATKATKSTVEVCQDERKQKATIRSKQIRDNGVYEFSIIHRNQATHKKLCFKDVRVKQVTPACTASATKLLSNKPHFTETDSREGTEPEIATKTSTTQQQPNAVGKPKSNDVILNQPRLITQPTEITGNLDTQSSQNSKSRKKSRLLLTKLQKQSFPKYSRYDKKYSYHHSASYSTTSQDNSILRYSLASNGSTVSGTITETGGPFPNSKDVDLSLSVTESSGPSRQLKSMPSNTPTGLISISPPNEQLTSPTTLFTEVDCPEETNCRRTKLVRTLAEDTSGASVSKKITTPQIDDVISKKINSRTNQISDGTQRDKQHKNLAITRSNNEGEKLDNIPRNERKLTGLVARDIQAEPGSSIGKNKATDEATAENVMKHDDKLIFENAEKTQLLDSSTSKRKENKGHRYDKSSSKDQYRKRHKEKSSTKLGVEQNVQFAESKLSLERIHGDLEIAPRRPIPNQSTGRAQKSTGVYSSSSGISVRRRPLIRNYNSKRTALDNYNRYFLDSENEISTDDDGWHGRGHGVWRKQINKNIPEIKTPHKTIARDGNFKEHTEVTGKEKVRKSGFLGKEGNPGTHFARDVTAVNCPHEVECLSESKSLSKKTKYGDSCDKKRLPGSESTNQKSRHGEHLRVLANSSQDSRHTRETDRGCVSLCETIPREYQGFYYRPSKYEILNTKKVDHLDAVLNVTTIKASENDSRDTSQISVDTTNVFTEMCLRSSVWNNTFSTVSESLDENCSIKTPSPHAQFSTLSDIKVNATVLKQDEVEHNDSLPEGVIFDSSIDIHKQGRSSSKERALLQPNIDVKPKIILNTRDVVTTDGRMEIPDLFKSLQSRGKVAAKSRISKQKSCHILKRNNHICDKVTCDTVEKESCIKNVHSETSVHKSVQRVFNDESMDVTKSETETKRKWMPSLRHVHRVIPNCPTRIEEASNNRFSSDSEVKDVTCGRVEDAVSLQVMSQRNLTLSRQASINKVIQKGVKVNNNQTGPHRAQYLWKGKSSPRTAYLRPPAPVLDSRSSCEDLFRKNASKSNIKEMSKVSFSKGSLIIHRKDNSKSIVKEISKVSFKKSDNISQGIDKYLKSPSLDLVTVAGDTDTGFGKGSSTDQIWGAVDDKVVERENHISHEDNGKQKVNNGKVNKRNWMKAKGGSESKQEDEKKQAFSRPSFLDWRGQSGRDLLTCIRSRTANRGHTNRMLLTERSFNDIASSPLLKLTEQQLAPPHNSHSLHPRETHPELNELNHCQALINPTINLPQLQSPGTFQSAIQYGSSTSNKKLHPQIKCAISDKTVVNPAAILDSTSSSKIIHRKMSDLNSYRQQNPYSKNISVDNNEKNQAGTSIYKQSKAVFSKFLQQPMEQLEHIQQLNQHKQQTKQLKEPTEQLENREQPKKPEQPKEVQLHPSITPEAACLCQDQLSRRPYLTHEESRVQHWNRVSPGSSAHPGECHRHVKTKVPSSETFVGKIVHLFETQSSALSNKKPSQTD